ncbi:portal protein [Paracoccus sp. NSM]|uniref:portal protein n=1 Tax=Paracoccus sp. NSM TaxID=3457784 RepID=UPI00403705DA
MFDIDFSSGRILTVNGHPYNSRPGEVPFLESAKAQIERDRASPPAKSRVSKLDSPEAIDLWKRLLATYRYELERQAQNRYEMSVDEDFYDHIQWTLEEIAELEARGQFPLVFNLIQTTINWMLGTQRRAPQDYKVLPRKKDGLQSAERKTELLRHLRDVNHSNQHVSMAFSDAVKAGIGWLEVGQGDPAEGVRVMDRRESWRNMLWDSRAQDMGLKDARYVTRMKWLDLDIAAALWPDRIGILEASREHRLLSAITSDYGDDASDSQEMDHHGSVGSDVTAGGAYLRDRIRCIEMWFKKPAAVPVLNNGQFRGEVFDEWSRGHWDELLHERASLVIRPREVMHVAVFTEFGLLDLRQSPYRHNQFPFTPIWGYRRARDGQPYGAIRGLRGPQKDLNKRASKALHHLSTVQVTVEEGTVQDIEELRDEAGRPDSVIVHKRGTNPPRIDKNTEVASAHLQLMETDARMIQSVGGVTDENLGRRSNATSGKAIMARQDQGSLATSVFFDNLRYASLLHGEKQMICIEQFYTEQDQIRITDSRGNPQWVDLNDPEHPENAIDMFKADFIIEEEDWRASTRQAQAEQLLELMERLAATAPQVVIQTLDLTVEALDVPKRDEIVKRIRQITGAADPDEDPNNPSPETIQRQQAAEAEAAMQQRAAEAEISEKEARAAKTAAEAKLMDMGLRGASLDQLKKAIEAAIQIAGAPAIGKAVDNLMATAQEDAAAAAGAGEPTEPPAMEPQDPMAEPAAPAAMPM